MLLTFNDLAKTQIGTTYDVCIAGAGMAGITLALKLADSGWRVLLLEAGAKDLSPDSQKFFRGNNTGRGYFDLDQARFRMAGGTSIYWGGWSRPFDSSDFVKYDHKPHSGWPIDRTELDRHTQPVCDILEIENDFTDIELPFPSGELNRIKFQFGPIRFGEKYYHNLERHQNITLCLNACLTNIAINTMSGRVKKFDVAGPGGQFLSLQSRYFVLAMGGIENARMLLASRSQVRQGLGNEHDLVGSFFCEHFHLRCGFFHAKREAWPFESERVFLAPTKKFQEDRKTGNASIRLEYLRPAQYGVLNQVMKSVDTFEETVEKFTQAFHELDNDLNITNGGHIRLVAEQLPNQASRISLSKDKDSLGIPVVDMNWQASDIDKRTIVESGLAVQRYLEKHQIGAVRFSNWFLDPGPEIPDVEQADWLGAGWHHMGTTRMAASAATGVVNADLEVFKHHNLFVTGTSVLPTGGHANPSFTALQLTLRLAGHLNGRLLADRNLALGRTNAGPKSQ